MGQLPRLGDRCIVPCQCLVGKAETEQGESQKSQYSYARAEPGLTDQRALGDRIVKRKRFFLMRA
jgi:hypothetical protein